MVIVMIWIWTIICLSFPLGKQYNKIPLNQMDTENVCTEKYLLSQACIKTRMSESLY